MAQVGGVPSQEGEIPMPWGVPEALVRVFQAKNIAIATGAWFLSLLPKLLWVEKEL